MFGQNTSVTVSFAILLAASPYLTPATKNSADALGQERIGVAMATGEGAPQIVRRGEERFPMCSTFKFLAVAAVLQRVDEGKEKLDRVIPYGERDLLEWAPITKQHVHEGGMKVEDLCFAAIAHSDNTAANLLLRTMGGPSGVTTYTRSLGDQVTRLDRMEPELNNFVRGDERDTTTPTAMLHDMQKILLGDALSTGSREKLEGWMSQNTTGDAMIRAGAPKGWRIADKTGSNRNSNSNDIAILRPPSGPPLFLAILVDYPDSSGEQRAKMIATIATELLTPH